jgi:hypothetical protein
LDCNTALTQARSNNTQGCRQNQHPKAITYRSSIMKTSTMFKAIAVATTLAAALSASVLAQSAPASPGMGMGPGASGMRGMRFDKSNTPGWTLMTAEERTANQTKMRAVKSYDECKTVQTEQHAAMQARAKEKGVTLNTPRQNACDRMKAKGLIK